MIVKRPVDFPKLKKYVPTRFMASTSHYDKAKADRAVLFIENLSHTKGKWEHQPFFLLPWQEQIVRDIFGVVKKDGTRQFKQAYIEIPKQNGMSELAAAIALYMLYADNEPSAEVYGAAADRQQASIVFDVAKRMVEMQDSLRRRSKIKMSSKRLINFDNSGFYQVSSADVVTKHGLNISALVFDELHTQPNRNLYDVLTKGSGDAREQPLYFYITTAGVNRNSICYELHQKAKAIIDGKKIDHTFYPVIYGLELDDDWHNEENWFKANPSLGQTIKLENIREAYQDALSNLAEENIFRQLRLNTWVSGNTRWMRMEDWDKCAFPVDIDKLKGRECYAGLDLSSSTDITAFVLVFPPEDEDDKYQIVPYFWIPEDTIDLRVRRDHVPYDIWKGKGTIMSTEGNVIHYGFIEKFIEELGMKFNIKEIAFDRWGAIQMTQNLESMGFTVVPFGQGYKDMSGPTKRLMELVLGKEIAHNGNEPLRWMIDNVVVKTDPAGNIKMDKEKSEERIDGAVALVMALDRAIRHEQSKTDSIYDGRGIIVI